MVDFRAKTQKWKEEKRINLNPSSADRWTTCTASPKYIYDNWEKLPKDDSTKFSQEGHTAHEVAAAFLQDRYIDRRKCETPITPEMRWHGWNYAEYVNDLRELGSTLLVEQKLPLFYAENRNAIVDAAVINRDNAHIIDYKYGEGVIVSPYQSLQASIYAKCVFSLKLERWLYEEFPITIHIYQPRGRAASDSPSHTWETTWGEIQEKAEKISKVANLIQGISPSELPYGIESLQFRQSEKACQFCPAKGFCAERQKQLTGGIEALATIDAAPKHLPPVASISVKQFAAILKHKEQIVRWLNDAEAYALQHMKSGNKIPGYKLALSRGGNRYWIDPKQAAKLLLESTVLRKSEVIEEKVIGPAAAEKLLGKQKFNVALTNLIGKPPGQPIIVSEDDPREDCFISAETEFTPLE